MSIALLVILVVIILILLRSIRITQEWRRAVVLRLGRFLAVKGPGLFLVLPFVDQVAVIIDMRIQTTSITAERALTRDTVAVGVDAIVFWQVEDAEVRGDPHRRLSPGDRARRADEPARDDRRERSHAPAERPPFGRRAAPADHRREDPDLGRGGALGRDPRRGDPHRSAGRDEPSGPGRA